MQMFVSSKVSFGHNLQTFILSLVLVVFILTAYYVEISPTQSNTITAYVEWFDCFKEMFQI